ncbi:MAG: YibE/F family protein [Micromonosporaceae bacterium]
MTHAHTGHHRHGLDDPRHPNGLTASWRLIAALLIPAAVITMVALIWLWPGGASGASAEDQPAAAQRVDGTVLAVNQTPCPAPPAGQPDSPLLPTVCGTVAVGLDSGPDAGRQVTVDVPAGPGAPRVATADKVVLFYQPEMPAERRYQITDHQRGRPLWLLTAVFALAVIAYGRWRGVRALAGLAVTFAVLLLFIVPAILDGKSPLLVAITGSAAIMFTVLYLTHGINLPTTVALVGTLISLTLTGLLAAATTAITKLSGIADEESGLLSVAHANVNMQGLLLAGILIGALGVLDDVTVTQATTVDELAYANPGMGVGQLYRAATRVGRAHIASVTNTIVLAYAGASLPLLLLISASNHPIGEVLTNQLIAQEIVRSAVGTIGLIAAVPITTALAALTAGHDRSLIQAPGPGGWAPS